MKYITTFSGIIANAIITDNTREDITSLPMLLLNEHDGVCDGSHEHKECNGGYRTRNNHVSYPCACYFRNIEYTDLWYSLWQILQET